MQQSQKPYVQFPGFVWIGFKHGPAIHNDLPPRVSKNIALDIDPEVGLRGAAIDLVDCPVWDLVTPAAFASLGGIQG